MVAGAGISVEKQDHHETHPSYAHVDADIVLLSDDGIRFQVHSVILKRGSDFFRAMLEMPGDREEDTDEPIRVSEPSEILVDLLNIVYPDGDPFPHILTFKHLSALYFAAEKYDIEKAKAIVRKLTLLSPETAVKENPLELYVLACKFGWETERKLALTWSLDINLHSPLSLRTLVKLDTVEDMIHLQALHRARRQVLDDEFKRTFQSITGGTLSPFAAHQFDILQLSFLMHAVSRSLDACPSGAELATEDFWDLHLKTVPNQTFKCRSCERITFDKNKIVSTCFKVLQDVQALSFDVPTIYDKI